MSTQTDKIREALEAHLRSIRAVWSKADQGLRDDLDKLRGETFAILSELEAQPSQTEDKPASFTEVATLALDLTEAIWPRVKGIEQYELTNLAERCIYKGMELRKKHVPLAQPSEPRLTVDQIMEFVKKWIAEMTPDSPIDPDEWNQPEWIKQESILRARLTKAAQ